MPESVPTTTVPPGPLELTVDGLAHRSGLPVRTIREYQTMGLLPSPERRGRVGIYRASHLARLELIERLQARGYSLAGIRDLLTSWSDGSDLGEVLGLSADELVHLDEPGAPATLDQLARLLPGVVPERLDDLLATGAVEACAPDRYCVPSPSLVLLAADMIAAGYSPDQALALLTAIRTATSAIADAAVTLLGDPPRGTDPHRVAALAARGRGLLAHGIGRLTIHTIGRLLGVDDESDADTAVLRALGAKR